MIACQIKHQLTGNLNARVDSCPPFPGKERHLLRATVARITHATELSPKGMYEVDEETNEIKLTEEFAMPEDIKSLESWAHNHSNILTVGRCSHTAPVGIPEEELDDFIAKRDEEDKVEERYRDLAQDAPITGLETAWTVKTCGDNQ